MPHLPQSLAAWDTPAFAATLARELAACGAALPLQQAAAHSSAVLDGDIEIMLLGASADADGIRARVGVFFSGIVAGCSCADDPTPIEAQPEYCELQLDIDRASAATTLRLL